MIAKRRMIGSLVGICWLVMCGDGKSFGQPVAMDALTEQFANYVRYVENRKGLVSRGVSNSDIAIKSLIGTPTENMARRILQAMREGNKEAPFLWLAFVDYVKKTKIGNLTLCCRSTSLGGEIEVFGGAVADALFFMGKEEKLQGVQWCLKFTDRITAPFYPGNYQRFLQIKQRLGGISGFAFHEVAIQDNIKWTIELMSRIEKDERTALAIWRIGSYFDGRIWLPPFVDEIRPPTRWKLLCDAFNGYKIIMRDYRSPGFLAKITAAAGRVWALVRKIGKRVPK